MVDEVPDPYDEKVSDTDNRSMRARSGAVNSSDALVQFLYVLMRDHLPTGVIEEIVRTHVRDTSLFTNGWLAEYAKDVADRLVPSE